MIGLSTSLKRRESKNTLLFKAIFILVAGFIFLLPSSLSANTAGNDNPKSANEGASWIQITGHSFQGDRLVINYVIQYPGMTKVKLFNSSNQMLWRGQYVNDKEGDHKIVVKSGVLQPGNYIFEFEYKGQKRTYPINL